jgi:UDP-glucose 4-epimerase
LVNKFLNEGHSAKVFDKNEEHYIGLLPNVDYYLGEFENRRLLLEALDGIDVVIHLISTALPKTSNDDHVCDNNSNVIKTLILLEQCVAKKIKKINVTASGGTVYGVTQSILVYEDRIKELICSYGISKLYIEEYLALFKKLHNLHHVIIRPLIHLGVGRILRGFRGLFLFF